MELKPNISIHPKIELSGAQCSHIATFIFTLGNHLKERQTQTHYILTEKETAFKG
jgi:hypothetical protein